MSFPINFGYTGAVPQNPIPATPPDAMKKNPVDQMIEGKDALSQGGVQVNFHSLNGVRLKFQVVTIDVKAAGSRYQFETQSNITNDRIVGITMTSTENAKDSFSSNLNNSTMQLTIDNEEIIPDGSDCSLFSAKLTSGFYENMYRINERADGSLVKGSYTSGTQNFPTGGYKVKIYLWSVTKPKK